MKSNAYLNGQDILNWYKTPFGMEFTDKGFPILEPLKSLSIPIQRTGGRQNKLNPVEMFPEVV